MPIIGLPVVNEGSESAYNVTFYDQEDNEETPVSIRYQCLNADTNQLIGTGVELSSGLESTMDIPIDTTHAGAQDYQNNILLVDATFAGSSPAKQDLPYRVKKLRTRPVITP